MIQIKNMLAILYFMLLNKTEQNSTTHTNSVLIVLLTMLNFHTLQRSYMKRKKQTYSKTYSHEKVPLILRRKQYHSNHISSGTVHFGGY